jgi:hypothetical protein
MLGFGFGEVLLIGLMLVVGLTTLVGFDFLKKGVQQRRDQELDSRILDELEVLRLRMDAINERLDSLDPSPATRKILPSSDVDKEST